MQEERYDRIMAQRAQKLAQTTESTHRTIEATVAVLVVGEQKLGVPAAELREIVPAPPVARLPALPPWLLGLAQIRGELISVVDTGRLFHSTEQTGPRFVAVIETSRGPVALAVDQVVGLRHLYADDIAESVHLGDADREQMIRFTTNDLVSVLDVERLVSNRNICVDTTPRHLNPQASSLDCPGGNAVEKDREEL
jgi:chemotaxis signal transduction protein